MDEHPAEVMGHDSVTDTRMHMNLQIEQRKGKVASRQFTHMSCKFCIPHPPPKKEKPKTKPNKEKKQTPRKQKNNKKKGETKKKMPLLLFVFCEAQKLFFYVPFFPPNFPWFACPIHDVQCYMVQYETKRKDVLSICSHLNILEVALTCLLKVWTQVISSGKREDK